jgi:hypothetical protein
MIAVLFGLLFIELDVTLYYPAYIVVQGITDASWATLHAFLFAFLGNRKSKKVKGFFAEKRTFI